MRSEESEFLINKQSDRKEFKRLAKHLKKKCNVKFLDENEIDADYLNYIDTVYWDFEYKNILFTLHLEQYTGIMIFTKSSVPNQNEIRTLNELVSMITQK